MNYIDQAEYNKLVQNFGKQAPKEVLKEGYVDLMPINLLEKELSDKQKKIAAAAPPEDKITGADFAALKAKKEEGLHLGKATGPTITAIEGKHDFSKLSVDERKQLKEYIESTKTIKQEINKLLEKARMTEGGDTTGLVMPEGDDDGEALDMIKKAEEKEAGEQAVMGQYDPQD